MNIEWFVLLIVFVLQLIFLLYITILLQFSQYFQVLRVSAYAFAASKYDLHVLHTS